MTMILMTCITMVLFQSYSCWILNDINPKAIADSLHITAEEVKNANFLKDIDFIYPGTLWCGGGNIADNYDQLGPEKEADSCCRDHDHCPDLIEGGGSKNNLTNTALYTRLNCKCDEAFHDCLKAAGTKAATVIGNLYFDALQTQCFREDYPVIKCTKRGGWFGTKCLEYSYDTSKPKVYQWFDVESF